MCSGAARFRRSQVQYTPRDPRLSRSGRRALLILLLFGFRSSALGRVRARTLQTCAIRSARKSPAFRESHLLAKLLQFQKTSFQLRQVGLLRLLLHRPIARKWRRFHAILLENFNRLAGQLRYLVQFLKVPVIRVVQLNHAGMYVM